MTDTYRIVGLAGRGAVATSDGQPQSHEPFLADLVLHADREIDLATAARAAAEALAQPHATLLPRAEGVAQAVRDAVDVTSVEVTLHRPEVGLGVPVLDVELTIVRPRAVPAGSGAGAPVDADVFAQAVPAPGPAVDDAQPFEPAAEDPSDADHTARHASRAGGPFDDVLTGRGVAAPHASGTLAGITGGALAAGGLGAVGGAAAGGAASSPAAPGASGVLGAPSAVDLEPDPSATTVRTPHPAVGDDVDGDDADRDDTDPDDDVRATAAEAGLAPDPDAEHVFQAPTAIEPEVEPESDSDSDSGLEFDLAEHDDVEPAPASAVAEPVPDPSAATALAAAVEEDDAVARTSVGWGGPGDDAHATTLPPTAMQARRPSADAPLPALVVLSGRGASAQNELAGAVRAIGTAAGLDVTGVSPLARTTTGAGDLHTAVVAVRTTLGPGDLAQALSAVSSSRPSIEAEILAVGDLVGVHDDVELPLPGVAASATVLVPWAHLDPQAILPGLGGGPVVVLAETAPDRESVRWLALDWLE